MNPATAFGAVLVDELVRHGLHEAVIAPGSRSAPLALALADDERLRLHVRHDERSAAFLALGLARGGGRRVPALVVCTSGTAAANLLPAVAEADLSGTPLLVATADRPPELRGTGANQTIDQLGLYGGRVRWFCEVGVPEGRPGAAAYWRSVASRAWAEAAGGLGGAPGPVHLNCPLREPLVPDAEAVARDLGGRSDDEPFTHSSPLTGQAPAQAVTDLVDLVERHERGVVVVGDGAGEQPGLLADLAERAGWPLLAEPHSGARRGPAAVTAYDGLLRHAPFADAHRPQAAVVVGRVGLSRALLGWLDTRVRQVVVVAPGRFADPGRTAGTALAVDVTSLAAQALERLGSATRPQAAWAAEWRAADGAATQAVDRVLDAEEAPSEPRLARDLGAALPDGAVLVVGSSMPIRDLDATLRPRAGLRIIANRGASGIDGFVSTAVGAALACGTPTVALAGDLSLIHDQNGLLVPPGDDTPDLVVVVANNDGGGIFSLLPQAGLPAHFERVFGTPHGVDLARLAQVYGHGHQRLERAADLGGLVDGARRAGGIQLVEARTDRTTNAALHRRLLAAIASALDARAGASR